MLEFSQGVGNLPTLVLVAYDYPFSETLLRHCCIKLAILEEQKSRVAPDNIGVGLVRPEVPAIRPRLIL
jgi:hypothetical protein